jgi:hypothetical protein
VLHHHRNVLDAVKRRNSQQAIGGHALDYEKDEANSMITATVDLSRQYSPHNWGGPMAQLELIGIEALGMVELKLFEFQAQLAPEVGQLDFPSRRQSTELSRRRPQVVGMFVVFFLALFTWS